METVNIYIFDLFTLYPSGFSGMAVVSIPTKGLHWFCDSTKPRVPAAVCRSRPDRIRHQHHRCSGLEIPLFTTDPGQYELGSQCLFVSFDTGPSPAFYLADGKLNFVKVRCFSSFAQSGLEDVVRPRALLALGNLQLRGQSIVPTPVVYAGDLTVFSTNPKEAHLQESLSQLRNLIQVQCWHPKTVMQGEKSVLF